MSDTYTRADIRSILRSANVDIVSETGTDFLCLCPFHRNMDTPSFAVSYSKGLFVCYNPSCGVGGTILDLVKELTGRNDFEAMRFISSNRLTSEELLEQELQDVLEEKPDFIEFPQVTLDSLHKSLLASQEGKDYLASRKIYDDAIEYFDLGYSEKQDMVTVPLHAPDGLAVGLIGRSISGKSFKNSVNLPRNKTMFNLHRAKRQGGTIIITESSFDTIRLWQAGYPNAIATLGGSISDININHLNRYASTLIIMTDNDNAGRALGNNIANKLKSKNIYWAKYDNNVIYPNSSKDVGDMTDEQIKQCVKNAIPHFEYALM
jgi:DNA primase